MHDEWSPWITHTGSTCPCVGMWVLVETTQPWDLAAIPNEAVVHAPRSFEYRPSDAQGRGWTWDPRTPRILRYRMRRPKALMQMIISAESAREPLTPAYAA